MIISNPLLIFSKHRMLIQKQRIPPCSEEIEKCNACLRLSVITKIKKLEKQNTTFKEQYKDQQIGTYWL